MSHTHVTLIETVVVETQLRFSLAELSRACGAESDAIAALVHEGVLAPQGEGPEHWQFAGSELPRARRATRLMRDLELGAAGVALVLDLLHEIDALRAQLRHA